MTLNSGKIGIIGGSGLDDPQIFRNIRKTKIETPYGPTSEVLVEGEVAGKRVVVLARHGKKHTISPSMVPYRANIWALKEAGCDLILATTACGSLREEYKPGKLVFVDQLIDFTKSRKTTYFEDRVVHTPMAEPFDEKLRKILVRAAKELKTDYHPKGTMITIEGPRFSSRAEAIMFRGWGADLINMSTATEVILANELGVPYQAIAMVTDYDCWKKNEEPVTFELVLKRMRENSEKVKKLLIKAIEMLPVGW